MDHIRMNLLPLDDSRWRELCHRSWSIGEPSVWTPNSPFVPDVLARLLEQPEDLNTFQGFWPLLCSEGTVWSAAYAVVPYAVELARCVSMTDRIEYVCFVGLVAQCSCPESGTPFEVKDYLMEDYHKALQLALSLAVETLVQRHDQTETRYLLSTIAALKGHPKLADVLAHIDCICGECKCGELVFPEELQQVT